MKPALLCFLVFVVAAIGHAATRPASATFTAKELAQGYREHVILARPRATNRATVDTAESNENVRVRQKFERMNDLRVIELDDSDNADAAIARLQATGRYDFVEPDYIRHVQVSPNDPKYLDGSMWAINNTGQTGNVIGVAGADIKALTAWDILHDASNVVVAVVDTGISLTHQDIASNLWTNSSPTNGDLHGANFVGGNGSMVSGNPSDDEGHGTHVAGTIGAVGNNGIASVGIAWKVQLMAIKVLDSGGSGTTTDIVAGINYAIAHNANLINASYGSNIGSSYSNSELTAIASARSAGIIVVVAAGNDSADLDVSHTYPASFALDNIVSVGSSNRRDEVSSFSNYGAAVDLFAPGEEIVSLDYSTTNGTVTYSGTSMATPHVTGALALLKAQHPTETYRQLINRLLRGVDRKTNFIGKVQTGGRLNLYNALSSTTNTPFNDNFAERPTLTALNLAIRSNNAGATTETGEPAIAGYAASGSLWWEWTAPSSGTISVDTSGSAYDTLLAVYTGTSVGGLSLVGSNDNSATGNTSRLSFTAQAGTTYEITVGGKNGATGLTLLNLGTTPANDAFASPTVLSGQSLHLTSTNLHCSREANEPSILGFSGGNSLWYQWTAPRTARFQVAALSTDFDPILAVYTGTSLTSLTLVSASDNTGPSNSQTAALCTIDATAGVTYLITVDSKTATTAGQFTLSLVDSLWQATTTAAITGSPAVAGDGTVYVGSAYSDNHLYAFAADGTQKWSVATGGSIDTCSPAIASDGTVYVGSNDGKCYAVNTDGSIKWTHNFNPGATATVAAGSSPAIAADGTIYQGSDENDNGFYAFNPDGSRKWRFTTTSGIYGVPALDSSGNIYFSSLTGSLYCLTAAGAEKWPHINSGITISSSVALSADGGTFYYGGYDGKLYARNPSDGSVKWTYSLGTEVRASSPAIDANGVIYIGCYDDRLYAVNADGTLNRTFDAANIIRSAPAIVGNRLYVGSSDQKLYAFSLTAGPAIGPWPQYRANARRLGRAIVPSITTQPESREVGSGYPFTLSVVATGDGPFTYQWSKDGVAIAGATNSSYTVATSSASNAGSYAVTIAGTAAVTSSVAVVTIAQPNPGRLINLSVRTNASGSSSLFLGFVVSQTSTKPLLVRGVGPALIPAPFSITDAVPDPSVQLLDSAKTVLAQNDNWDGSAAMSAVFNSVGAFPLTVGSKDAALTQTVAAGQYYVQISAGSGQGTALAEIYDLDATDRSTIGVVGRLTNLSARSQVDTGNHVLIAGFGISGNVPKQVLIRAVGPTLGSAPFSVPGVLADPQLQLYDKSSNLITSNDDWGGSSTLSDAFTKVSAFGLPTGSKDSVLLVTLQPGTYSAVVSGVNSTTGVALIELYEMP